MFGPPNDERGFIHGKLKRLAGGVIRTFVPGGGVALDIAGGVLRGRGQRPQEIRRSTAARTKFGGGRGFSPLRIAGPRGCPAGLVRDVTGNCVFPGSPADLSGAGGFRGGGGETIMGQYGPAMRPGNMPIQRADCSQGGQLRGMILGNDGLCYNRRDVSNKERMWPRGPRPLGTPEEMRAIRIASRFAGRFERTTKRMQKIGLAKRPASRRRAPKQIAPRSGITVIDTE